MAVNAQIERLLVEQEGDLMYDISRAKIALARLEAELLRTRDAISDIRSEQTKGSD